MLIENAIGKAKQQLKARGEDVPIYAYDAFAALVRIGLIDQEKLAQWHGIVGLRKRIGREYMSVDMGRIFTLVRQGQYTFLLDFLRDPLNDETT